MSAYQSQAHVRGAECPPSNVHSPVSSSMAMDNEGKSKTMTSSREMKIQEDATSIWYIFMIICWLSQGHKNGSTRPRSWKSKKKECKKGEASEFHWRQTNKQTSRAESNWIESKAERFRPESSGQLVLLVSAYRQTATANPGSDRDRDGFLSLIVIEPYQNDRRASSQPHLRTETLAGMRQRRQRDRFWLCPPKQLQTIAANDLANEMETAVHGATRIKGVQRGMLLVCRSAALSGATTSCICMRSRQTGVAAGLVSVSGGDSVQRLKGQTQRRRCATPAKSTATAHSKNMYN